MRSLRVIESRVDRVPRDERVLCVVHTDRAVELDRCDLNFLTARYASPERLRSLPPFESLRPSREASPHLGAISLWAIDDHDWHRPTLIAHLRPESYKPQHALWRDGLLWVVGVEEIHLYDAQFAHVATLSDPWMAGGHSIAPTSNGTMITTWSASDSIIEVHAASLEVQNVWRLNDVGYGTNYPLERTDSVIDHYVHNDLQLTHINAAWPRRDGILVSLLIPGAIGMLRSDGEYREIARHYVGCHGVRVDHAERIYFCDSTVGTINFIDDQGRLLERYDCHSRWLHDALELAPGVFAAGLSDRNAVEITDWERRERVGDIDGSAFGEGVQSLAWSG